MYTRRDRASYSRIDKDGLLGVNSIVDAMQDCCLFHSEDIGHGAIKLLEKHRAWLVSSWHVVINRRPNMAEEFLVHTWPYKMKGIFGSRNFLMETDDKEVLAYADSKWFYFDEVEGKPVRVDDDELAAYPLEPPYDMDYSSRKVSAPENTELIQEVPVSENYLDTNRHVNNGQYVRLAVNVLPEGFDVEELRAEFRLAAKMGDTLYIRTAREEDIFHVVLSDKEGYPYFLCEFKERKK